MTNKIVIGLTTCLLGTSLLGMPWIARADQMAQEIPKNCELLKDAKDGQTTVRRVIKNPIDLDFKAFENNWNIDFAVPTATKFKSFKAALSPENTAVYDIAVNLKYNDDTTITVHDQKTALNRGQAYTFPFESPNGKQPYQVNLKVKGDNNIAYNASVMACR